MGDHSVGEYQARFHSGARWYISGKIRCGARAIIFNRVHECECDSSPHQFHAFVNTWDRPTTEEWNSLPVFGDYFEALK